MRGTRQSWGSCEWGVSHLPGVTSHMLGTGMKLTLMFQRKGHCTWQWVGTRLRPHRPLHPPRVWASLGTLCPPNLCMMGDRSSPSVMVSLVNPLIREVSRELWLGAGGWGWGTPTSMASHHCAAWGIACLRGDALGKMRGEIGGVRDHVALWPAQSPRLLSPGLALQSSPDPPHPPEAAALGLETYISASFLVSAGGTFIQ